MNPAVGVDLGTTNTVVAVQTDSTGAVLLDIPQPIHQRSVTEKCDHIKSAVYFESANSAVVGALAAIRLEAVRSIKSRMGTRWRATHPHDNNITLTPAYVSAHILRTVYEALTQSFPDWDKRALVTVPASFNTDQRRDTLAAARMAGFHQVGLLDEPTAAFYHFFDQNRHSFLDAPTKNVLVFDFGGGTLDVSVIRVTSDGASMKVDTIGRSRYNNLGGDDIDLDLASFFCALWQKESGSDISLLGSELRTRVCQRFVWVASAFKEEAEDYIRQDMDLNEFFIAEEISAGDEAILVSIQRRLSVEQYEQLSGRYFAHKNDVNVFRPIGQALDVAAHIVPGFNKEKIDLVLYTGGASRMRGVGKALAAYFAPARCYAINYDEACNTVALGAATCRYDEITGGRGVELASRLLESILSRDEGGTRYLPVVPLTCEPSEEFQNVLYEFHTPQSTVTLRVPLFRGSGVDDHNLMPMQDLEFKLPRVVDEGTAYHLDYRMTTDKTIQLRAVFGDEAIEMTAKIDMDVAERSLRHQGERLSSVNKAY